MQTTVPWVSSDLRYTGWYPFAFKFGEPAVMDLNSQIRYELVTYFVKWGTPKIRMYGNQRLLVFVTSFFMSATLSPCDVTSTLTAIL